MLFVCTANVARSPYAERRAKVLLHRVPLAFESAGAPGFPGYPIDEHMAEELRLRGGIPVGHVSRSLTGDLMREADLVLTFEYAQRLRVVDEWPEHRAKVRGLGQFSATLTSLPAPIHPHELIGVVDADATDSMAWDIEDPHGRGPEAAERCADEIDQALRRIAKAIGVEPVEYPTRASLHRGRRRRQLPWRGWR